MSVTLQTLFFDMNSFFASVAQQEEPQLIGRPVGVLTADDPNAACIAASIEAKRFGIGMGTRQAEARQLCPDIVFRPAKHDVCVRYHHAIRAAADEVIPIDKVHSVDEFTCRLMGSQQELDKALDLAAKVQARIRERVGTAMRSSVGLGPNHLLAKLAGELQKPDGINWLHPSVMPGKIAHLRLKDVPGISKGMLGRLDAKGIRDIPQLYAMAPKEARALWGNVNGERFLRELHGEVVEWPRETGKSLGHGQVLVGRNKSPEGARLVARRLLVKAGARLRREGLFAGALSVGVKTETGRESQSGEITPTQDSFFLLEIFERYWNALNVKNPISVNVMLSDLKSAESQMADLFAARPADEPTPREALCRKIDGLNQRFGQDTIRFGELPRQKVAYTGAKIAFGRIPEAAEFRE